MKKKLLLTCILLALSSSLFAHFDALLQVYAPFSVFNYNSGKDSILFEQPNFTTFSNTLSISIETRFKMFNVGKINFSGGVMFTPFLDTFNTSKQIFSFSTGIGANYDFLSFLSWHRDLSGLTVFVYPIFYFPLFTNGTNISYRFKSAFEVGYNITLAKYFTVYLFERNIVCWDVNNFRFLPDFGFAIGFNFPLDGKFPEKK